jgi:hypothetical protein
VPGAPLHVVLLLWCNASLGVFAGCLSSCA